MRKLLLAAIAATAIAGTSASAADMAVKAPPPAPVPSINWTGIYIGGHVGYAWTDASYLSNHVDGVGPCVGGLFVTPCDPVSSNPEGFVGGGQLGARWQTGRWVLGVEGTYTYVNLSQTTNSVSIPAGLTYFTKLKDVYTATGQVGYTWDRALVYVKGGYAGGRFDLNSLTIPGGTIGPASASANGWTIGGGLEYSVTPNLSVGAEYNHIRLEGGNASVCSPSAGSVFSCPIPPGLPLKYADIRDNIDQVLLRVNYRFNWLSGPVVAKY